MEEYDELSLLRDNADEAGLAWSGPPAVRRTEVDIGDGLAVSALVWGTTPPELVLIHGGGWGAGAPELLAPMAACFAERGMVAVNIGYRLTSEEGVRVFDCVSDVKQAVAWVADHAGELGVDPSRIAVAGDSAGGHLAACAGMVPGFLAEGRTNETAVAAMILYNPVIDTASEDGWPMRGYPEHERRALSPAGHVRAGLPPTLVIHGEADSCTPFQWSERFVEAMHAAGNVVEFMPLPGVDHAFVIPGYGRHASIDAAVARTDRFLREQGLLE